MIEHTTLIFFSELNKLAVPRVNFLNYDFAKYDSALEMTSILELVEYCKGKIFGFGQFTIDPNLEVDKLKESSNKVRLIETKTLAFGKS